MKCLAVDEIEDLVIELDPHHLVAGGVLEDELETRV